MSEMSQYRNWIGELKKRYRATQIKAAIAVNGALIEFYWELGRDICRLYPGKKRGISFFENLSHDLQVGVDDPKGLSERNIRYALAFYELYSYLQQVVADNVSGENRMSQVTDENDDGNSYLQQVVADKVGQTRLVADLIRIPWGHHILLIGKCQGDREKALYYVGKTIEHHWSRNDLARALAAQWFENKRQAVTNFEKTLPEPEGYLAAELVKSPYSFELLEAVDQNNERAIERALVRNITSTLTELGGGFAYVGHQVRVTVGGKDFWPDLIFYHLAQRRYLVIELKVGEFAPEHIGQLGFYMTAVDRQIKHEWDGKTFGLVLCESTDRTVVEYALADSERPMGVAQYSLKYTAEPPEDLKGIAPTLAKLGPVVDETIAEVKAARKAEAGEA